MSSLVTTEEQLMSLEPRTRIYRYNSGRHDIEWWDVLARVPYNTIEIMAFYRGNTMIQIGKHQLNVPTFTDHDEAYRFLAQKLRDEADAVERIHLNQ
jgi:hypothetical protein